MNTFLGIATEIIAHRATVAGLDCRQVDGGRRVACRFQRSSSGRLSDRVRSFRTTS
jgi:hypothetical protein